MARTRPARSRKLPRLPPTGGGPPKTERPESFPADRPIDHHVAGPTPSTQISPGARGTIATTPPHNHSPPTLDGGPDSDKQQWPDQPARLLLLVRSRSAAAVAASAPPKAGVDPDERQQNDDADDRADDASEIEDVVVADPQPYGEDQVPKQCPAQAKDEGEQPRRRPMQLTPHVRDEYPPGDPCHKTHQQRSDHCSCSLRRVCAAYAAAPPVLKPNNAPA